MRLAVSIFLLFAAVFLFWYDFFLASLILIVLALFILLSKPLHGFGSELAKDLESAEGQVPDKSVWEEGLKTAGAMAGAQTHSDYETKRRWKDVEVTKWRLKADKGGTASKKVIDFFKKLFG